MNAVVSLAGEPAALRTEAEKQLSRSFDTLGGLLPGGGSVAAGRNRAIAYFRQRGLPHRRIEEWKYTDLRALVRNAAPVGVGSRDAALPVAVDPLGGLDRARIVVADGGYRPDLSDLGGLDGLTVRSTADALAANDPLIGALVPEDRDGALALNTALMLGGVILEAAPGAVVSRPVEIVHLRTGSEAQATFVRNIVRVGEGASLRLIETHRGSGEAAHQTNAVFELDIGRGARVKWAKLQAEGESSLHVGHLFARVADEARFDHITVTAGAGVSRSEATVAIAGSGVELNLLGATMIAGRQHADATLTISHLAPGSTSRVKFRNVAADRAEGAFQGKISVAQVAQKTDGKMMTQTLLLSEEASFALKPELEIFADDVQCGHGATSGQIDEDMLFYFMARGIPRPEAERLLVQAFLAEALEAFGDEAIGGALEAVVEGWLSRRAVAVVR